MREGFMKKILLGAATLAFTVFAVSMAAASSMYGYYAPHDCSPPYAKPTTPYGGFTSQWEVDSYNSDVQVFNDELETFYECINDYITEGNRDIEEIQRQQRSARSDADNLYF
jgi:hypothetical protein